MAIEEKHTSTFSADCATSVQPNAAGFSPNQLRKLNRAINPEHVHLREIEGKKFSYIEGWYAIAQANEIFGYAGWDREVVHFERIHERTRGDIAICGYLARVRIRVRAGAELIMREGSGSGWAKARTIGDAHERALKSAETDATKRALATFGCQFGLSLYDRAHHDGSGRSRPTITLFAPNGQSLSDNLSPEGFSTGLRQLIEHSKCVEDIDGLASHNAAGLINLRAFAPSLRNGQGAHFADLLQRLMERARRRFEGPALRDAGISEHVANDFGGATVSQFPPPTEDFSRASNIAPQKGKGVDVFSPHHSDTLPTSVSMRIIVDDDKLMGEVVPLNLHQRVTLDPPSQGAVADNPRSDLTDRQITGVVAAPMDEPIQPSKIGSGGRIDKSALSGGLERRIRDKAHLRKISDLPCLVCNRQPSHAHHLRFAQKRGLGQKVSDEYVVPLCALHHGDLHHCVSETDWWIKQGIDPLPIASELWAHHRSSI